MWEVRRTIPAAGPPERHGRTGGKDLSEGAMGTPNSNLKKTAEFSLTAESFGDYLQQHGLVRDPSELAIRQLGGGVSNVVLLVEGPEGRWVAKQSLGKLRVEDDWRSSRERVFREAAAIESLAPVLGDAVPRVVHVDRGNFLYLMTAAPENSVMWKQSLLEGKVERRIAETAGKLLAKIINASQADAAYKRQFSDRTVFDQLRIDPYYRTVGARHRDVAEFLRQLIQDSWEIQTSLVHGDYSPKNMLVRGNKVFLIDFEVVHWGDPSFDAAFLLNHLMLKSFYRPWDAGHYFQAARAFWKALTMGLGGFGGKGFEAMTVRHLGGLMLARIDGKSPVEYIRDEGTKTRARKVAKHLLVERPPSLEAAFMHIEKGIVQK
jgi:aminoglycoside phosphotransferase (APT) family kinase protein